MVDEKVKPKKEKTDQELKTNKDKHSIVLANKAFKMAVIQIAVVVLIALFAPEAVLGKLTAIQDFLIYGLVGWFGIIGAYVGVSIYKDFKK